MAETSDTTYYDKQARDGYADGVEAAKADSPTPLPWGGKHYSDPMPIGPLVTCLLCSALVHVSRTDAHSRWHAEKGI